MKIAAEVIRTCLKEKGWTQSRLAVELHEDVRVLNQQLNRQNDMKVERMAKILQTMGYHLEAVRDDADRGIASGIEIRV